MIKFVWDAVEFWIGLFLTALGNASDLERVLVLSLIAQEFRAVGWL